MRRRQYEPVLMRSRSNLRTDLEAIQVGSIPDRSHKNANVHIQVLGPVHTEITLTELQT